MKTPLLVALGAILQLPVLAMAQGSAEPFSLSGRRTRASAFVPALRDAVADSSRVAAWLEACKLAATALAPQLRTPAVAGGALAIVSWPSASSPVTCPDSRGERLVAGYGILLDDDSTAREDGGVVSVRLERDGRPVTALETRALDVERRGVGDVARGRVSAAVTYIALDSIAPAADGRFGALRVLSTFGDGTVDTLVMDAFILRAAWEGSLALRTELASGWYRAGMRMDERRRLQAEVGAALYASGDVAGARVAFAALLDVAPCMTLGASAPEGLRATVAALARPDARCTAQSTTRTALRAAALPGFGRPRTPGQNLLRFPTWTLLAAGLATAVVSEGEARSSYDSYLAFQAAPEDPEDYRPGADYWYRRSERARVLQNTAWVSVGALWAAQLVYAVVTERQHAAELGRQQNFEIAAPRLGLRLQPIGRAVGIGLELQW